GDTVINKTGYQSLRPYYNFIRQLNGTFSDATRQQILNDPDLPLAVHPVDKTDNYIKRCVAIPGDSLKVINGILYVNGQPAFVSPTSATFYVFKTNDVMIDEDQLRDAGIKLNQEEDDPDFSAGTGYTYRINLTLPELEKLKKIPGVIATSISKEIDPPTAGPVFPYDTSYFKWSLDN